MRQENHQEIDTRLARVQQLRAAVVDPVALVAEANQLLMLTPRQCTHLIAFCPEGHAVASAAATLALADGRELGVHLASHLAPLAPAPAREGWRWMSVEQALGLGPVRPWVARWARQRGGEEALAPSVARQLAQVI